MKNTKYRDAITGEKIDLKNRIVHDHDLDDYTGQAETFFHPLNQKGWIEVNEPRSGSGLVIFYIIYSRIFVFNFHAIGSDIVYAIGTGHTVWPFSGYTSFS